MRGCCGGGGRLGMRGYALCRLWFIGRACEGLSSRLVDVPVAGIKRTCLALSFCLALCMYVKGTCLMSSPGMLGRNCPIHDCGCGHNARCDLELYRTA